jgi:hypothetical protein
MVYTWNWSGGFYEAIFYFYYIKSGGPYKSGGIWWSAGFYEEKNKKLLQKISRTNSMVYTIVSTRPKSEKIIAVQKIGADFFWVDYVFGLLISPEICPKQHFLG